MASEEIQKHAEDIKKTYQVYLNKLLALKKEQDQVIADFEEALKNGQIEEIKKSNGL